MRASFADFIVSNKNCSGFEFNADAIKIFDFLSQDDKIIKMIEYAEMGKPALAGCVLELEKLYDELEQPTIDFNDGFTRTVVGRMVKSILSPFGYCVGKQKDFPKNRKGKYFTSASCYKLNEEDARMRVVKKIEEI